jgi:D-3-phosphoglycerate dehydrogenase
MALFAAEQIVCILKGGRPPRLINPEVWPTYVRRFEEILGAPVQPLSDDLD